MKDDLDMLRRIRPSTRPWSECVDWSRVPESLRHQVTQWVEGRSLPDSPFLRAVLANDLRTACIAADVSELNNLGPLVKFLSACAPRNCWGNRENMLEWVR